MLRSQFVYQTTPWLDRSLRRSGSQIDTTCSSSNDSWLIGPSFLTMEMVVRTALIVPERNRERMIVDVHLFTVRQIADASEAC